LENNEWKRFEDQFKYWEEEIEIRFVSLIKEIENNSNKLTKKIKLIERKAFKKKSDSNSTIKFISSGSIKIDLKDIGFIYPEYAEKPKAENLVEMIKRIHQHLK
jgi:hypothetical protein